MGKVLRHRLLQERFESPHHEAILNLLVAAAHIRERLEEACARHGITRGQYNVLRILRGVHPEGYPRCDIARRLIERASDVTRLIDRLSAAGLVERHASERDRRLSVTRVTRKGLALLDRMRGEIAAVEAELTSRLGADDARALSAICERIYGPVAE